MVFVRLRISSSVWTRPADSNSGPSCKFRGSFPVFESLFQGDRGGAEYAAEAQRC